MSRRTEPTVRAGRRAGTHAACLVTALLLFGCGIGPDDGDGLSEADGGEAPSGERTEESAGQPVDEREEAFVESPAAANPGGPDEPVGEPAGEPGPGEPIEGPVVDVPVAPVTEPPEPTAVDALASAFDSSVHVRPDLKVSVRTHAILNEDVSGTVVVNVRRERIEAPSVGRAATGTHRRRSADGYRRRRRVVARGWLPRGERRRAVLDRRRSRRLPRARRRTGWSHRGGARPARPARHRRRAGRDGVHGRRRRDPGRQPREHRDRARPRSMAPLQALLDAAVARRPDRAAAGTFRRGRSTRCTSGWT